MIRSLSPYYIDVPWVSVASGLTCESYTLSVYIWNGLKASVPATADFTFTKTNATNQTGTDSTIDIARIIADYIDVNPIDNVGTGALSAQASYWVKWEYTYITTDPTDATTPQGATTKLFSRGYSYGFEGGNIETITNNILFQGDEFKANREGVYCLPFITSETIDTTYSVLSYPDSEINVSNTFVANTTANEITKLFWIDLSETTTDTYAVVTINAVDVATILIQDEYKYTPVDIIFQNKLGFQQSFTFLKERKDRIAVTSSEFESDRGQPSLGNHQFVKYNVQARGEFEVFTGFIDESNNETIQQILLSEKIWVYDGSTFLPVNIKTKSQEWKTQVNDKLVNYSLTFEYSYNEVNNI